MVNRQHEDEEELARAILTGAERRDKQSFGTYFGPEGGSCALGAAYEGVYLLPDDVRGTHPNRMDRFFHCLEDVSKRCPAGCRKSVPIGAMIVHLNDDHRWTREQIASWLRGDPPAAAERANDAGKPVDG
jgi:hypothetical protein